MKVPDRVKEILKKLEKQGYEGYVVGGCVRDNLLGKVPKDWDITTNATPTEVKKVFKGYRIVETGLQHGTVTIVIEQEGYEVTTYRVDGEYTDGRRPDNVVFTRSLREDLARRDFTINAIAYNEKDGYVDYYGGIKDIKQGIIRAVGNPEERFNEDGLRILRALRFSAVLGFDIEKSTSKAIYTCLGMLDNVAEERKREELLKSIVGKNVVDVYSKYRKVIGMVIPELIPTFDFKQYSKYHHLDVWQHSLRVVSRIPNKYPLIRVAGLLHDIGKPNYFTRDKEGIGHFYGHPKGSEELAQVVLNRLCFSNTEKEYILQLVKYHDFNFRPTRKFVLRQWHKLGKDTLDDLMVLKKADILGHKHTETSERFLITWEETKKLIVAMKEEKLCFTLKDLSVNGNILQSDLGILPGREMGEILKGVLVKVVAEEIENDLEVILEYIKDEYLSK